ncbi:hypothetical protein HDV62DRAFT_354964 [Trichoderma sp. SZMC 28011]
MPNHLGCAAVRASQTDALLCLSIRSRAVVLYHGSGPAQRDRRKDPRNHGCDHLTMDQGQAANPTMHGEQLTLESCTPEMADLQ